MGYNEEIVFNEYYYTLPDMLEALSDEELYYHNSWDWLMPAIDEIEKLGYGVEIVGNYTRIIGTTIFCSQPSKIKAGFKAAVEFINWYNKQNKNE